MDHRTEHSGRRWSEHGVTCCRCRRAAFLAFGFLSSGWMVRHSENGAERRTRRSGRCRRVPRAQQDVVSHYRPPFLLGPNRTSSSIQRTEPCMLGCKAAPLSAAADGTLATSRLYLSSAFLCADKRTRRSSRQRLGRPHRRARASAVSRLSSVVLSLGPERLIMLRRAATLSALAMLAYAQAPQAPINKSVTLNGTVIDVASTLPIEGAYAFLEGDNSEGSYNATTDRSGHFSIRDIAPGTYRLFATGRGYPVQEYGARGPRRWGRPVVLSSELSSLNMRLLLTPSGVLKGRIVDDHNHPVFPAAVDLLEKRPYLGSLDTVVVATKEISRDGTYQFNTLVPGQYYLRVRRAVIAAERIAPNEHVPDCLPSVSYYPGGSTIETAGAVTVNGGVETDLGDLPMSGGRCFSLDVTIDSGSLSDTGRRLDLLPAAGTALPKDGLPLSSAIVRPGQRSVQFTELSPGTYMLIASLGGIDKAFNTKAITITDANVTDSIAAMATGKLVGHVELTSDTSVDTLLFDDLKVKITSVELLGWEREATVDAKGTFEVDNLGSGEFYIGVAGQPANVISDELLVNGVMKAGHRFTHDGEASDRISVRLRKCAGTVEGVATDEKDREPRIATILLVPPDVDEHIDRVLVSIAKPDGRFSVPSVPAGRYRAFALDDVQWGAYYDPTYLAAYKDQGKEIAVEQNAVSGIHLSIIHTK